jgi:hypothetical protein
MSRTTFAGMLVLAACTLVFTATASAQSGGVYTITSSTIDGGGATFSTGGTYSLGGTIGQPDAGGPMTGGTYSLTGGFWAGVVDLLRGDATGDSTRTVLDVFYLINNLFAGGPPAPSLCQGDANNIGSIEVTDVFFLINYLFAGGTAPASC